MQRDRVTDTGVLVVGSAAAVLTFTTLSELGTAVGFTDAPGGFRLAWLLPVTLDAAGIVAARVWLRGHAHPDAVRYARQLALVCIVLSVAGNATAHLMQLAATGAPWWVVLPVTSVPPAVLAAVVHLGHLLSREDTPEDRTEVRTEVRTAVPDPDLTPPVRADLEVVPAVPAPAPVAALEPVPEDSEDSPEDRTGDSPGCPGTGPDLRGQGVPADLSSVLDPVLTAVLDEARRTGAVPSRKDIQGRHKIGTGRAADIRRAALAELDRGRGAE